MIQFQFLSYESHFSISQQSTTKTSTIPHFFTQKTPTKNLIKFTKNHKTPQKSHYPKIQCHTPNQNLNNTHQIDMVQTKQGLYIPKRSKVVILWDLDNKPPRGPPYEAAISLKNVASRFGEVVEMSAYANRHAFKHLPTWVVAERQERRRLDYLEKKGIVNSSEPYICKVCGRKCRTNLDLKKHFKQLHERERQKKLNRMKQLKGKKRVKFKERYLDKNEKFEVAARELIDPKVGYGLARELRRAGVFVKTVEDKPQAADWALKKQMLHSMSRGIDWLFLVSDDSDFKEMILKAREASLGTVVIGDKDRSLGRYADLWVEWSGVEKGEVSEKDLVPRRKGVGEVDWGDEGVGSNDGLFSISRFEDEDGIEIRSELDDIVNELLGGQKDRSVNGRFSAFSEGEDDEDLEDEEDEEEYDDLDEDSDSDYDED